MYASRFQVLIFGKCSKDFALRCSLQTAINSVLFQNAFLSLLCVVLLGMGSGKVDSLSTTWMMRVNRTGRMNSVELGGLGLVQFWACS